MAALRDLHSVDAVALLAVLQDGNLVVWQLPSVVMVDRDLLPLTQHLRDARLATCCPQHSTCATPG